ncbi:hypothetical protein [Nocardioides panaciterrulae]|uniref:Peptidase S74 domain-containing protein n=1 Tax=Nocardioides panaciterrulae TaxID=661492 RepID=A0A7Y9JCY6_9ACTN|nr:hypothetical protein [Nocardioides panaciterrulae]NYD43928.1 hypothetical protein [Nocardioides panaciterrulae]NYD43997.1 hypothetical protein [Nocardioides panaciterrulae]
MSVRVDQLLRLEVERDPDPGELLNLVPNPSGELGAWGWVTPVAGSLLRSVSGMGLTYTSPGGADSYFYTEPMPVAAGGYVAASWQAPSVDGKYTAQIEWLDVSKTLTGSTAPTAQLQGSLTYRQIGSTAVPAGAAYCRLRFDHYAADGGQPIASTWMAVLDVTVTEAAASDGLVWQRTNLMPTPTGAQGVGGWSAHGGASVGTSSYHQLDGEASLTITKTGDTTGPARLASELMPVTGGRDYLLAARSRPGGHRRDVTLSARWLKANGDEIATVALRTVTETPDDWTAQITALATAPTNATHVRLRVEYGNLAPGEVHYVNQVQVEPFRGFGFTSFFDGASTPTAGETYAWAGTPYASASIATSATGDVGTLVPVPYQNILGPSANITVDREDLNVGSMSVQLFDAILDPTQNDLIRQGRRIRLVTVDGDVLFAGKVLTGAVTYHLLQANEQKRAEVNLTAVDPINTLAGTPRLEGVATIAELPYLLEGAGVPWSCNGSGDQVAAATVVAYNGNASVLDQVAVTRDTVLGFAWVDRNGVLQAWDRDQIDSTVAATLDETSYNTDLDIAFDLDKVINSVTVRVLRVIATSGSTEELVFGPYVDQASYQQYGEHAAEYTVQGFDPADAAGIQAYAQQILDVNATPALRVNSMVLPIRGTDDLAKAKLDLYDLVAVSNDRAGLADDSRITTITHTITPGKWLVTLGFTVDGAVASANAVPAPPPGVGGVKDDIDGTLDGVQGNLDQLNNVTLPQVQSDLSQAKTDISGLQGKFPITSTSISDGAITTPKLAANSITGDKIVGNTITGSKIVGLSITGDKIAGNSISGDKIVGNSITADKLDANAINGKTITGSTLQTAASGQRVTVSTSGDIKLYTGDASEVSPGGLYSLVTGGWLQTRLFSPQSSTGAASSIWLNGDLSTNGDIELLPRGGNGNTLNYGQMHSTQGLFDDSENGGGNGRAANFNNLGRLVPASSSTLEVKDNVTALPDDDDLARKYLELQGYTFTMKGEADDPAKRTYAGFIVDYVEAMGAEMEPWLLRDQDHVAGGISYDRVPALQQVILRYHERRADALQAEVDDLRTQLEALAQRVTALEQPAS